MGHDEVISSELSCLTGEKGWTLIFISDLADHPNVELSTDKCFTIERLPHRLCIHLENTAVFESNENELLVLEICG